MKTYYVQLANGESDFFEAKTDHSAYTKAGKFSRQQESHIEYLAETFEDSEVDRVIVDEKVVTNPEDVVYDEKAYDIARKNTPHDKNGRATISKDDEWVKESEWDEMFTQMASENKTCSK